MNTATLTALIVAITSLLGNVGTIIGLFRTNRKIANTPAGGSNSASGPPAGS